MNRRHDSDCARIYELWHNYAKDREGQKLLDLYADDAILETPLVMAILDNKQTGILSGRDELRQFIDEGLRRRPDELVRWYRTGLFFTNGEVVTWEYPRQTPTGNQIDLVEVMNVQNGKIQHHRIYWGWFGFQLLLKNAIKKAIGRPA
jgi:SnoaL-like domain